MTIRNYSSRAQQTTLAGAIGAADVSATVVSGANLMGGVTPATSTYTVVIDPDTTLEEILDVTAVSGNILTIVRGIDGSTGVAHSAGAIVRHMVIGRDLREANNHSEGVTTAHGLTIANVVSTTSSGVVTSAMITDGTIVNADVATGAAIAYSKLALAASITSADIVDGTIVNADVSASAALAYSKLALTGSVVDADVSATAAIAWTKLAPSATVSATELGYVDGVTSAIQTQLDSKLNKSGGAMTGAIAMGTNQITGVGNPTLAQDAATKAYADSIVATAPGNLTGPITSVGAATAVASQTGTGTKFVMEQSPTLVTPVLGVATATSINVSGDITLSATNGAGSIQDRLTLILMDAI